MRQTFLIFILTLFLFSCDNKNQSKTPLPDSTHIMNNDKIDSTPKISDTIGKMILISSGQAEPYKEVKINGHDFDLVLRDGDTIYLATIDQTFKTPEGFHVGMQLSELPQDVQKSLTKEPGWAYYFKMTSGWTLGFCEGNSCTDNYPNSYSKVQWLFKRK